MPLFLIATVPRIHSAWHTRRWPTMSPSSGGSRRATALLPGATPAQANIVSACDARSDPGIGWGLDLSILATVQSRWIATRRAGRWRSTSRHKTERFVFPQHGHRILQPTPSNADNGHSFAPSLGHTLKHGVVLRHSVHRHPGSLGQHAPQVGRPTPDITCNNVSPVYNMKQCGTGFQPVGSAR